MSKKPHPFPKQRDLTRAWRATQAAGIKARIEVDIPRKKFTIIPIDEPAKDGDGTGNELDKWMSDHAREPERT